MLFLPQNPVYFIFYILYDIVYTIAANEGILRNCYYRGLLALLTRGVLGEIENWPFWQKVF